MDEFTKSYNRELTWIISNSNLPFLASNSTVDEVFNMLFDPFSGMSGAIYTKEDIFTRIPNYLSRIGDIFLSQEEKGNIYQQMVGTHTTQEMTKFLENYHKNSELAVKIKSLWTTDSKTSGLYSPRRNALGFTQYATTGGVVPLPGTIYSHESGHVLYDWLYARRSGKIGNPLSLTTERRMDKAFSFLEQVRFEKELKSKYPIITESGIKYLTEPSEMLARGLSHYVSDSFQETVEMRNLIADLEYTGILNNDIKRYFKEIGSGLNKIAEKNIEKALRGGKNIPGISKLFSSESNVKEFMSGPKGKYFFRFFGKPLLIPGFQEGGPVLGNDEVLAILHKGEFVLTKEQTEKAGLNRGRSVNDLLAGLPRFKKGGLVVPSPGDYVNIGGYILTKQQAEEFRYLYGEYPTPRLIKNLLKGAKNLDLLVGTEIPPATPKNLFTNRDATGKFSSLTPPPTATVVSNPQGLPLSEGVQITQEQLAQTIAQATNEALGDQPGGITDKQTARAQAAAAARAAANTARYTAMSTGSLGGALGQITGEWQSEFGAPFNPAKAKISTAPYDDTGTRRLRVTIDSLTEGMQRLTKVVDAAGNVYTEDEYKQKKKREALDITTSDQIIKQQRAQAQRTSEYGTYKESFPGLFRQAGRVDTRFTDMSDESLRISRVKVAEGKAKYTFSVGSKESKDFSQASYMVDELTQKVTKLQSTAARGFGGSLMKDMASFAMWSLAIGLIYTPLTKLNQLITETIANEAKLADVAIVLGGNQDMVNTVFESAVKIASETGVALGGVIDGYAQAYAATAALGDVEKRTATANQLMTDSLILSKIGMMTQSEATDILIAALTQAGLPLDKGTDLLDKWITVSNRAGTSVKTLATTFAIVGETASQAGMSIEQLNAMAAIMEKSGVAGPQQVANSVRAVITGVQNPGAVTQLAQMGISTTLLGGEAQRPFLDILKQVSEMYKEGNMSVTQLNQLARAWAGGNRNLARVITAIMTENQIAPLEQAQKAAGGEAKRALEIEMGTVQTSITNLGTAFSELGMVIGTEGGLLSALKSLVEVATAGVKGLSGVTSTLGASTSGILTTGIGAAILGFKGKGFSGGLTAASSLFGKGATITGEPPSFMDTFKNVGGTVLAGAFAVAIPAAINANKGNITSAWGDVIMGGMGAAIGGTLGGPMGAMIGGTIGAAISDYIMGDIRRQAASGSYSESIKNLWKQPYLGTKEANEVAAVGELSPDEKFKARIQELAAQRLSAINPGKNIAPGNEMYEVAVAAGVEEMRKWQQKVITGKQYELIAASQANPEAYAAAVTEWKNSIELFAEDLKKLSGTETRATGLENSPEFQALVAAAIETARTTAQKEYYAPEKGIGAKEYKTQIDSINRLSESLPTIMAALTPAGAPVDQKTFDNLSKIMVKGTEEQKLALVDMAATITSMEGIIEQFRQNPDQTIVPFANRDWTLKEAKDTLDTTLEDLAGSIKKFVLDIKVIMPSVLDISKLTKDDLNKIYQDALKERQKYLDALTEEQRAQALKLEANAPPILPLTVEGYQAPIEGIQSSWMQQSQQNLLATGKIGGRTWQQFDVTESKFWDLMNGKLPGIPGYEDIKKVMERMGYVAQENPAETIIGIFKDMHMGEITGKDMKLIQLLLQSLVDIDQKQLDGMYNLPEGASFWLPESAVRQYYGRGGGTADWSKLAGADSSLMTRTTTNMATAASIATIIPKAIAVLAATSLLPSTMGQTAARGATSLITPAFSAYLPGAGGMVTKNNPLEVFDKLESDFAKTAPTRNLTELNNANQNVSTRLNLTIDSKTTLVLDGRQIANALQRYFVARLISYSGNNGGAAVAV